MSQGIPEQVSHLPAAASLQLTLYTYNWSPDLGSSLASSLVRLLQWQNARSHVVHCLLSQKLGLFHHYCYMDTPWHEDAKQVQCPPTSVCPVPARRAELGKVLATAAHSAQVVQAAPGINMSHGPPAHHPSTAAVDVALSVLWEPACDWVGVTCGPGPGQVG